MDLSIGQPYHDVPEPLKQSAIRAILDGKNRYTPTQGSPALVREITGLIAKKADVSNKKAMVTCGVAGGIFLAIGALINPGDEVLMPDPYFSIYKQTVRFYGGVPVTVDTYPDFELTADRIEPHITPRSKILIFSSPSNPTGAVVPADELVKIARLAEKHNLLVLSDEIYSTFSYEREHESMLGLCDNLLFFSGYSKSHAAPGWRIGYVFGPAEIIEQMAKIQQNSCVCAPSPMQAAIAENINLDITSVTADYRRKRDILCDGLRGKFDFNVPAGAFYLFPKAPWGTGTEFVEAAIKNNLLIVPGAIFSRRDTHFRISYAADELTIRRGVEILSRLAAR